MFAPYGSWEAGDSFKTLSSGVGTTLTIELNFDKFNLFDSPFFSPGRINFPFNLSVEDMEGKVIGAVFFMDQRNDLFDTYMVELDTGFYHYWSHPNLDAFAEDLIVKFYL